MADQQAYVLIVGTESDTLQHGDELDTLTLEIAASMKKKGFSTILISSNPFSFSLDAQMAIDHAEIVPVTSTNVEELIEKYHPQYIVPTLGGRHAFEVVQEVAESGALQKHNVAVLGNPLSTIRQINNPVMLSRTLHSMDAPTKKIETVDNYQAADDVVSQIGYPAIIRSIMPRTSSFWRIVHDRSEMHEAVTIGLQRSRAGQILVQQSLAGLKEIEVIVLRDASGTMMQLAMVEDIDPIGTHAGDSIAVTPAQTLLDREIQDMRDTAFAITRKLRVVGINHVQFALDEDKEQFYVIKNSPYLDRMSTFVSRATGYPVGTVVGQLYAGMNLVDIHLDHAYYRHAAVTEPTMDRVAVRVPVWPSSILHGKNRLLSTQKKSLGSVIGIGRSLEEALCKAMSFDRGEDLRLQKEREMSEDDLVAGLINPQIDRFYLLMEALRRGYSPDELSEMTKIDEYYFVELRKLLGLVAELRQHPGDADLLQQAKYLGIPDKLIAALWKIGEGRVAALRHSNGINRTYKMVEPTGGEFATDVETYYSTFEMEDESKLEASPSVMIVGTGPFKLGIGSAGDYFYAAVMAKLRHYGYRTIVVNNNPSSVILSPLLANKRYIEPLIAENIQSIVGIEHPDYLLIPSSRSDLVENINVNDETNLLVMPIDRNRGINSHLPLYNCDLLYDGNQLFPLAVTADYQSPINLNYQATHQYLPVELSVPDKAQVDRLIDQCGSLLTKPGLYQLVLVVQQDGTIQREGLLPLPLTDVAFLSKVLGIDLPGLYCQIATNILDDEQQVSVAHPRPVARAVYQAQFPFQSLRVQNGQLSVKNVMGATMFLVPDQTEK